MADAWTNLVENSSLNSGDAWEYLLSQEGGSGGPTRYVAENGIVFSINPINFIFNNSINKFSFEYKQPSFNFSATDTSITIKLANINYTFHGERVLE